MIYYNKFKTSDLIINEITDPSMKAFMDDVTVVAESRSHMEQLLTRLQDLFKWAAMKIKPSKFLQFINN